MGRSTVAVANLGHELEPVVANHGYPTISSAVLDAAALAAAANGVVVVANCEYLEIQVETATVRVTVNGADPSATVGRRLIAGTVVRMSEVEWGAAKWIREGATDAVLQVAQYSRP